MRRFWTFGILLITAVAGLHADVGDPPSRVARLNYLDGSVSFQPGGEDNWVPAVPNRPLITGDRLWTEADSHAELHIGSLAIRMGGLTAFDLLNLDDNLLQIRLSEGRLNIRLRELFDNEAVEIDTPQGAISLLRAGEYRIEVKPDGQTAWVLTRSGDIEVSSGGQAFPVHPRQLATLNGTDSMAYQITDMPAPDGFDNWCLNRDQREDHAAEVSARYVSREMVGYEDLADNGVWRDVPGYGPCWEPRGVVAGWAPYHYGRWAWVEPWGWTWIDDAPWGFAPFHYGRWANARGVWVWVPGAMVRRPVYAPALVAFVGGGAHWGVSISVRGGGGPVGWFPLGPREPYYPAYHVSNTYVRNVNITHVTNINVINVRNVTNVTYVNQRVPGAMMAVRGDAFAGAQPVQRARIDVNAQMAAEARVSGHSPAIAPQRNSVLGVHAAMADRAGHPPAQAFSRQVVGKATPPPPPVSFAQRQQYLSANPGRPLDAQTLSHIQAARPAAAVQQQQYVRPAMGGRMTSAPVNSNPNLTPQQPPRPQMDRPPRVVPNESPRPNQVEQERLARPREQAAPVPQQSRPPMERPARVVPNESPRLNQVEQERLARPSEQAAPVPQQSRPPLERPARVVPNESPRPNQVEQEQLARPREKAAPVPQQSRPPMERPARVVPNESPRPNQVEQERLAHPREQAAPVHPVNPVSPPPHDIPSTPRPEMERANRPAPRAEQHTEEKRPPHTEEKAAEHPKSERREEGKEKEKKQ